MHGIRSKGVKRKEKSSKTKEKIGPEMKGNFTANQNLSYKALGNTKKSYKEIKILTYLILCFYAVRCHANEVETNFPFYIFLSSLFPILRHLFDFSS